MIQANFAGIPRACTVTLDGLLQTERLLCYVMFVAPVLIAFNLGCESTLPDHEARLPYGHTYYLDGAGGGATSSWSRGVMKGLQEAEYPGAAQVFVWQTGLGVVRDQNSSVNYKKGKAANLAEQIREYQQEHSGSPVTLIGLSAGTAVTLFTLEDLPADHQVENAVLLGSSVNANYDLTAALRRVRGRLYVFTSEQDTVLKFLVPIAGTADRASGQIPSAGLRGFQTPGAASPETRRQYAKVAHVRWRPEFREAGHRGGHTDVVNPRFVARHVAPLVIKDTPAVAARPGKAPAGMVANPDYERWTRFAPGSRIIWEGEEVIDGKRRPLRIAVRLVRRTTDLAITERTYEWLDDSDEDTDRTQEFIAEAWIKSEDHPLTHPRTVTQAAGGEVVRIKGKDYRCSVRTLESDADFTDWGQDLRLRIWLTDDIPGGVARVQMEGRKNDQPFTFEGTVVDFKIDAGG